MRIGQRLFLAVLPAIVGLLTVAALAYFGEYARRAPEWLIVTAVVAAIGSAMLAWRNTRYVALRVEQLARERADAPSGEAPVAGRSPRTRSDLLGLAWRPLAGRGDGADELDRIESAVHQLTAQLTASRTELADERRRLAQERDEYAALVEGAVDDALALVEELRLPLHILLDNHFGELNENQEEMLGAARDAAETADARLRRLREVARIDRGSARLRRDRVRMAEVVEAALQPLREGAAEREVDIVLDLSPALPTIEADRARLQGAMAELLDAVLRACPAGGALRLTGAANDDELQLTVHGASIDVGSPVIALATRVIRAHGGGTEMAGTTFVVHLPRHVPHADRAPG